MDFYHYFDQIELDYASGYGQSATRWFVDSTYDELARERIAQSGMLNGFCVSRVDCLSWQKVSDWKQICLDVMHHLTWKLPTGQEISGLENIVFHAAEWLIGQGNDEKVIDDKVTDDKIRGAYSTSWTDQNWAMHEGVRVCFERIIEQARKQEAMREGEQAIIRLFLRGSKPAVNLLRANRLHALRDPLSERNAEAFLWSVFAGIRALGIPGTMVLVRLGDDARALENRTAAFYRLKWQDGAFALRRWVDRAVSANGLGCYFHVWCSEETLVAFGECYPAFGQRLDVLHRPAIPPYRTPIQSKRAVESEPVRMLDHELANTHALGMIHALRFGLVPSGQIANMTLGMERLDQWLANGRHVSPNVLIGDYGAGKSHFLQVIRHRLLANHAVVSMIELDGRRCSWARAELLLVEVVHAMSTSLYELWELAWAENGQQVVMELQKRTLDQTSKEYIPFRHFWEGMAATMSLNREERPRWQSRMLSIVLKTGAEWRKDELSEWREFGLSFSLDQIKPWIDRFKLKRSLSFVMALKELSNLAAIAGRKWSVLVDEADYDVRALYDDPDAEEDAIRLMEAVRLQAGEIPFVLALTPLFASGLDQRVSKPIDSSGEVSNRVLIAYQNWIRQSEQSPFWIPSWTIEDRIALAEKINSIYTEAYGKSIPNNHNLIRMFDRMIVKQQDVRLDQIRQFIKWYVHLLDVGYGPREVNAQEVSARQ